MTKKTSTPPIKRKRQWFAPRQVYLRTGQDSQYVELSPLLQIGVALGFAALALWLVGASYGAVTGFLGQGEKTSLLAELEIVTEERDAAALELARIPELEATLADARTATAKAQQVDETIALAAELEQTKAQLDDLRARLSEAKADEAALQARFEAQTTGGDDPSDRTAEEASSLYGQLEETISEIESLQTERDEARAKLAAITEESAAKDDQADRNGALLQAATAEIERLQKDIAEADIAAKKKATDAEATIAELTSMLESKTAARDELENQVNQLLTEREAEAKKNVKAKEQVADFEATITELRSALELETATRDELENQVSQLTAELDANTNAAVQVVDVKSTDDADDHVRAIAADLKEADLLATIEDLRKKITSDEAGSRQNADIDEIQQLKEQLMLAESEVERMIRNALLDDGNGSGTDSADETTTAQTAGNPVEVERLTSELANAQADNIKLRADVKVAKQRLTERAVVDEDVAAKPGNTDKLQQQLASTRSRVQQLNKALADAKLREVAIDLALINVIPSPSPPAPR